MATLLVQAGHYPNGGGAPGEANWTWALAGRLRSRLEAAGVRVVLAGDWYGQPAPAVVKHDYALFVSLHYDAAIYPTNTGCFADRARDDPQAAASDRAVRCWEAIYPAATGIPLHNERRNARTWDYYGFRDTTAKTPGLLIEHGVGQGLDHAVLFDGIDRVADADARALLAFLALTPPAPPVEDPTMLTDAQATAVAALAWNERSVPFEPTFAIPAAWVTEWKAGRYRGLPRSGELDGPDGTKVQPFDLGLAVWVPNQGVTWTA